MRSRRDGWRANAGPSYLPAGADQARLVGQIDTELRTQGTPERAEHERAYLKSGLEHYGTSVPVIRAVAKDRPGKAHRRSAAWPREAGANPGAATLKVEKTRSIPSSVMPRSRS